MWLDNEINHGQAWNQVIKQHLHQCQVFLLVMSPRAEQSPWVRNEMLYAINKRKVIFPLLLEGEYWFDVLGWQGADVTLATYRRNASLTMWAATFPGWEPLPSHYPCKMCCRTRSPRPRPRMYNTHHHHQAQSRLTASPRKEGWTTAACATCSRSVTGAMPTPKPGTAC